jgi:hypothetical protein
MRRISKEEFDKMRLKIGRNSPLRLHLLSLEPNEGLVITRQEYGAKCGPYPTMKRLEKKTGRRFKLGKRLEDANWALLRMK